MDELRFRSQKEKHECPTSTKRKSGTWASGRNGGEYYTPRPLIRAMIQVTKPKIGERIYDGALGSAGFLCEAYEYLRRENLDHQRAQNYATRTFYARKIRALAYVMRR